MEQPIELMEILRSMKEKAEDAYLNGQVATARHLAAVALEVYPSEASIDGISWSFSILLHCYKNDTDYSYLNHRYFTSSETGRECRFDTSNSSYAVFLSFMIEVLHPPMSKTSLDEWRKQFAELSALKVEDDVCTALLLETVVETLCFLEVENWTELGRHIISKLKNPEGYVAQQVGQCMCRLDMQTRILKGERVPERQIQGLMWVEQPLARAWNAYFDSDFHALDELIPALSASVGCDSEYFLAVQGLITATKMQRSLTRDLVHNEPGERKEQSALQDVLTVTAEASGVQQRTWDHFEIDQERGFEADRELEFANYYRYQRYETERPLAMFLAARESSAANLAHKIREKAILRESVAGDCWNLMRTAPFLWAGTLRYWDILGLLQSYEFLMEFYWAAALHFEDSEYCGEADRAAKAIISGIMSLNSQSCMRKDTRQLIGVLERYGTDEAVARLYHFILEDAPPITWNICASWLRLLGDLLPEGQLRELLDWTQRYKDMSMSRRLLTTLNVKEYYYLNPILHNYPLEKRDIQILWFHFEKMFQSPQHIYMEQQEFEDILWYLADNHWDDCRKLMEKTLDWEEYPLFQHKIANALIRLSEHNKMAKDYCAKLLSRRAEVTGCRQYYEIAEVVRNKDSVGRPDMEEVCAALRKAVCSMTPKSYRSDILKPVYEEINYKNLRCLEERCLRKVLDTATLCLVGEKDVYPTYRVDVLKILRVLFESAEASAQQLLAQMLINNLAKFEALFQHERPASVALARIRISIYRPEHLYLELLLTFCQLYSGMTEVQKLKVVQYICEGLCHYPQHTYYPTYFLLRVATESMPFSACVGAGFAQLKFLAFQNREIGDERLQEILWGIESAQEQCDLSNSDYIQEFVLSAIVEGADSINFQTRLRAAKNIRNLSDDMQEKGSDIIKTLSRDKRKSIRNIIENRQLSK